jgi:hypothetical protein
MKRTVLALALALALVFSAGALAGSFTYANQYWSAGQGAGTYYSSSWFQNRFNKSAPGFDTTITFIDNISYGWHSTVRGPGQFLETHWLSSQVKKAHCRANVSNFNGICVAYS